MPEDEYHDEHDEYHEDSDEPAVATTSDRPAPRRTVAASRC